MIPPLLALGLALLLQIPASSTLMLNLYILQFYTDRNIFVPSVSIFLLLGLSLPIVYFDFVS